MSIAASVMVMTLAHARPARAARPWVDRPLTLARHTFAFNLGVGIAHARGTLGPGCNLEGAGAINDKLELGFRTGLRFGDAAEAGHADAYGRLFDTETYGDGGDVVLSNPEVYVRGAVVEGGVFEMALEARGFTPFSDGPGVMFALPMALHLGRSMRLDTGVYVPVLFYGPTEALVSFPAHLWFQATDRLFLGPLSGVRLHSNGGSADVPLGFGVGLSVARSVDFKAELLFSDVAHGGAEHWGLGGGVEVRIE